MATINELQPPYRVGYFVGSLSENSVNRILSRALLRLAPQELVFTEIPIGGLPLYNRDLDGDFPEAAREFKVFYQKVPNRDGTSYNVDHTAASYVLDTEGRLRLFVRHAQPAEEIVSDLRQLL